MSWRRQLTATYKKMVRSFTKLYFNWTLQQDISAAVTKLSSVIEEFKVAKYRLVMTLRGLMRSKGPECWSTDKVGRKWSAAKAVDQAASMLEFRDIIGNSCRGRIGIEVSHFQQWAKTNKTDNRSMVQGEMRRKIGDGRKSKAQ